jgi:hypothetical protein
MNLQKYKQNLKIEGNKVISYVTHVATIEYDENYNKTGNLIQLGWWSQTTQKHINYVARELNLNLIK